MRQGDLFTTGLLENQPAASPPLHGENKTTFITLFEKVIARKLLINRLVYSPETVHPEHL